LQIVTPGNLDDSCAQQRTPVLNVGVEDDLVKLVQDWGASGLASEDSLRVTVYPHDVDVVPAGSERVISKRWTHLDCT
jgi:hypothetical protein